MVNSTVISITPSTHADRHAVGGADPLVNPLLLHAARHAPAGADPISTTPTVMSGDLVGSRALNTNYTNTDTIAHFVTVMTATGAGGDEINVYVKASSPANVEVISQKTDPGNNNVDFVVPAGYTCRVVAVGANSTLAHWYEWQ